MSDCPQWSELYQRAAEELAALRAQFEELANGHGVLLDAYERLRKAVEKFLAEGVDDYDMLRAALAESRTDQAGVQ